MSSFGISPPCGRSALYNHKHALPLVNDECVKTSEQKYAPNVASLYYHTDVATWQHTGVEPTAATTGSLHAEQGMQLPWLCEDTIAQSITLAAHMIAFQRSLLTCDIRTCACRNMQTSWDIA